MISLLYNIIWYCALPFLTRNSRLSFGLEERYGKRLPPQCDIWFHGASAGEITLITECIRQLKYTRPLTILITTWTKEGKQIAEHCKQWIITHHPMLSMHISYVPFDTKKAINRFLNATKPSLILIAETELWYMLLTQAKKQNIPICIFNARLSKKTYRYARLLRFLFSSCNPNHIIAISEQDKKRFSYLFPHSSLTTMHNIKFQSLTLEQESLHEENPYIVFASIRNKEFPLIAQTIQLLQSTFLHTSFSQKVMLSSHTFSLKDIRYYIIPRHLHHINQLINALQQEHISYSLCNTLEQVKKSSTPTTIINIFGVSKTIYSTAHIVFIGGSLFPEYGGHNFLEPLLYGIVPIVGPYRDTFLWAQEGLEEKKLLYSLQGTTPHHIARAIEEQFILSEDKSLIQQRFTTWIQNKQDGSQAIQHLLKRYNLV